MRAMAVTAYGQPLEVIDAEEPRLRPGFALLEVLTCGVCYSDVKTSRGQMPYSDSLQLPHIPGHEICGRVIESDPVGALPTGTTVVAYHIWPCRRCGLCRAGYDNLCTNPVSWTGFTHPGGFRDRIVVPLDRLTVVPDNIDPIRAAPLTCALGTAYRAVITRGEIAAGTRAVIIGLGGVGIHALQIARATGAGVVGLDVSQPSIDAALDLDLDARERRRLSGRNRFGQKPRRSRCRHRLCRSRRDSCTSGPPRPARRKGRRGRLLDYIEFLAADSSLRARGNRAHWVALRVDGRARAAIRLVADGHVQMVVDKGRPLERVNDAIADLEAGNVIGRTVIDVAGVA